MSNGSRVPLHTLLVVSLRDELETYMDHQARSPHHWPRRAAGADRGSRGCSDVLFSDGTSAFIAHNEDAMAAVADTAALLDVAVPGAPRFVA